MSRDGWSDLKADMFAITMIKKKATTTEWDGRSACIPFEMKRSTLLAACPVDSCTLNTILSNPTLLRVYYNPKPY